MICFKADDEESVIYNKIICKEMFTMLFFCVRKQTKIEENFKKYSHEVRVLLNFAKKALLPASLESKNNTIALNFGKIIILCAMTL